MKSQGEQIHLLPDLTANSKQRPDKYSKEFELHCPKMLVTTLVLLLFTQSITHGAVAHAIPKENDAEYTDSGTANKDDNSYGVVIDAGSSGSRARIYQWSARVNLTTLPQFKEIANKKVKPGISAFGNNIAGLKAYILPLIDMAKSTIPADKHDSSSLYLMATAGMRLLLEDKANDVIDELDHIFSDKSANPFRYKSLNTRILSGEEEGLFAWIATNYLNGFFAAGNKQHSTGIMELGGASTQIAFIPEGSILADKYPAKIAGKTYALYTHSYLYYGQDYVQKRIEERLQEKNPNKQKINNPCFLKGDTKKATVAGKEYQFDGTGDVNACLALIDNFVYKPDSHFCYPKPCAIGTVYQPTISASHQFVALSAFVYPPQRVGAVDTNGVITPAKLLQGATDLYKLTFQQVVQKTGNADYASTECLIALYMSRLFTKGYGFSDTTTQIKTLKKINNQSIEWPLGAIIYETERRACNATPK